MFKRNRLRLVGLAVSPVLLVGVAIAIAQDRPPARQDVPADINKAFQDPQLDADRYVERFESESREVFAQREAIAAVVGLEPGMAVADVGAGTGLFTFLFAEQVKPEGTVYAVDIAPAFLKLIGERAEDRKLAEVVQTVKGAQNATNLAPQSVDVVFMCDTYHHFENPTPMLRSIRRALRPGGRLVIVEFDREKADTDFVRSHVRAGREEFIREISEAGFARLHLDDAPDLAENFLASFMKVPLRQEKAAGARP